MKQEHYDIAFGDAELVESSGHLSGDKIDVRVIIDFFGCSIYYAWMRRELRKVFETVSVEREVVWNVDVW